MRYTISFQCEQSLYFCAAVLGKKWVHVVFHVVVRLMFYMSWYTNLWWRGCISCWWTCEVVAIFKYESKFDVNSLGGIGMKSFGNIDLRLCLVIWLLHCLTLCACEVVAAFKYALKLTWSNWMINNMK